MKHEKSEFEDDYKALHAAALGLSTRMLASLGQHSLDIAERATKQGARLVMQLTLPDCQHVELVLVELEGTRLPVARIGVEP